MRRLVVVVSLHMAKRLGWTIILLLWSSSGIPVARGNEFEPYVLNGGLLAAVAGPNYCLVATDTRLVGATGYDILERQHVSSRIWNARNNPKRDEFFGADGSLRFPSPTNDNNNNNNNHHETTVDPMVLIASAGCQADCEMLKRTLRSEIRQSQRELQVLQTRNVAVLLSQTLYQRRGFPWYAFCIVAGLEHADAHQEDDNETNLIDGGGGDGGGQVFVYDAIGSYEAVAVATSGTGRELLQPILDRSFTPLLDKHTEDGATLRIARYPRVQQTAQEACQLLVQAFGSVAERQVTTGDHVVVCCLERMEGGRTRCWTRAFPLKKH